MLVYVIILTYHLTYLCCVEYYVKYGTFGNSSTVFASVYHKVIRMRVHVDDGDMSYCGCVSSVQMFRCGQCKKEFTSLPGARKHQDGRYADKRSPYQKAGDFCHSILYMFHHHVCWTTCHIVWRYAYHRVRLCVCVHVSRLWMCK